MPRIRIVNATNYQNGGANLISAAAQAKLSSQLNHAATIDTRMASHRFGNDYLKVEERIASRIAIWRGTNRMGNLTQVDGLPFTNNGDVYVVLSDKSPGPGGHNAAAFFDLNNNRIVINPAFAELLANDKVFYVSSNGVRKTLTIADVILHELGHRSDGNSLSSFEGMNENPSNGRPVDLDAEKLEALNQISTNSDERFRIDHGNLYMYDANGVPHSIQDMTVEQIRQTYPGLISNSPTARILNGLDGKTYLVDGPNGGTVELSEFGGVFGRMAGSSLGNYLTRNDSTGIQIAASTVLGSIGAALGNVIVYNNAASDLSLSFDAAFNNFDQTLYNNLKSASIGALTAFTTMELGRAVGLSGFGAELFNAAAGSAVGPVYDKVLNNIFSNKAAFDGFNSEGIFGGSANVGNLVGAGIASFFGAKLGSLVVSPNTSGSAALASLGSAAGAYALSGGGSAAIGGIAAKVFGQLGLYANIIGPGIGAFVGFVLGAFIGNLFGKKKPRVPSASAEVSLNLDQGQFQLGTVSSSNGGNTAFVTSMALTAEKTLDGILADIMNGHRSRISSLYSPSQTYGHSGQQIQARFLGGAWQTFATADAAVDWGVVAAIKSTGVSGGNLLAKRAVVASPATNVSALLGDLQVAYDYELYLRNKSTINAMIANDPKSEFSAAWIITLGRVSELGLNALKPSDFQGGIGGFIDGSVDGSSSSIPKYENFIWNGSSSLTSIDGSFSPVVSGDGFNVLFSGGLSQIGYTQWNGQASSGHDFWNASGNGPVVMDDLGYQEEWRWNPWDYTYEPYYTEVSGGDDAFIGSSYNDTLSGRQGFDWLDGGAGDDIIDGGDQDDVLIGRAGNDRLLGGSGNDYLAGGDGDDYFYDASRNWGLYGGQGNDVLVGGAGMDALYGDDGDDVFIVDQDGGGTWDALTGMGGSDTLSYERFNGGVYVDFAVLGGWSWDPTAKFIYGDAIAGSMENVTGTEFDDTVYGDSGDNVIRGLAGTDYLNGRGGNDVLEGGTGADVLVGGGGSDTVSYEHSAEAVSVDLATGGAFGGDAAGDAFSGISNVRGSAFNDVLSGDAASNVLSGSNGDDTIVMTSGDDMIDGGDGVDTIDSSFSSGALTVYYDSGWYDPYYGYYTPGAGWIATTGSGTTTFSGIEKFVGSSFADSISGSGADEIFDGRAGNDYFSGGGGSDTFVFGRGDGQDTAYSATAGSSAISLKENINWRDVSIGGANYGQQNGNLVVGIRGTSDQILIGNNFSYVNSGNSAGQHNHAIKSLDLGRVSTVDIDMIDWTPYAADDNSTVVYGAQNRADLIFAYAGDDVIYTAGNSYNFETRGNVVYAGDGSDTIYGSAGDDQYIFERGNGADYLVDQGGTDTIVMGPSVAADDVIFSVESTDLGSNGYGSRADLYIGLRDSGNPNAPAGYVADRIRIVDGGMKLVDVNSGYETLNTIEHVRVAGQEIDLTKANINWMTSYYYGGGYYPIALDLDGDGIELRSVEGSRIAGVEADGTVTRMGWLGQDDGFLALDRDGNGVIDRIGEISFIADKEGAKTDLEGLSAYDSNADGKFDGNDRRWNEFKVWQDRNQDGFGAKNELVSLERAGIASISLTGQLTGFTRADGLDNTVIATTEVQWADKDRTGSAYDVMLARLQVRTDGGGKAPATVDALARGNMIDDIEARLHGVQILTEEQINTIRDRKALNRGQGEGGLLYRIEDLLGSASIKLGKGTSAKTAADGLLSVDPALTAKIAAGGRNLGMIDRYADSDWTKLGSVALGQGESRDSSPSPERRDLAVEQQAVIADARRIVAERQLVGKAASTVLAANEGNDAMPVPIPPNFAEQERLKRLDKFKMVGGPAKGAPTDADPDGIARPTMRQSISAKSKEASNATADIPVVQDRASADALPVNQEAAAAPDAADASISLAKPEKPKLPDIAGSDMETYGVVIRTANARLVQALASFGDAPAMMASYQGGNIANAAQEAWLSVDAMPSIQRLVAIR